MNIQLHHFYISRGHNFVGHHGQAAGTHPAESVPKIHCISGKGIVGDRYFDHKPDYKGQITFFDYAVYTQMIHDLNLPDASSDRMRRNVIMEGIDLNTLIGQRFKIGEVMFQGVEECKPCYWMNQAVGKGALNFLAHRGGLRARILTDGWLTSGKAELEVLAPAGT